MSRCRMDLKAAKFEPINEGGGAGGFPRATQEIHPAWRQPRVAMELMHHSIMKLMVFTYTDAGQLPTRKAIKALPSLLKCTPCCTPE